MLRLCEIIRGGQRDFGLSRLAISQAQIGSLPMFDGSFDSG
jgi:hypothetical protein